MAISLYAIFSILLCSITAVRSQLSDCHNHGTVRYCVLPNGEETAVPESITGVSSSSPTATKPASAEVQTTAVTECHLHGATQYCINGNSEELMVIATVTTTGSPLPSSYTGCHSHGDELYCYGPDEEETPFAAEEAAIAVPTEDAVSASTSDEEPERNCHFHAGVEHCVGAGESETEPTCSRVERDYNIPLRIGTIFAMLATSSIAVFTPILLIRFSRIEAHGSVFIILKQFGTGVIISTAFVHLLTHAQLMFANECLGELKYESTTSAIVMAGAFLAFLLQYISMRVSDARSTLVASDMRNSQEASSEEESGKSSHLQQASKEHSVIPFRQQDTISVLTLEMGIIFHSILIGITLVVSGDSFYIILFIVISFHQGFEGLALGVRLAGLPSSPSSPLPTSSYTPDPHTTFAHPPARQPPTRYTPFPHKLLLATAFALITPLGMAIGTGVLGHFNGNDKATIIAIGTLDALSAGILLWSGFVQMWSQDWLYGELRGVGWLKGGLGMGAFVGGLVVMSALAKWA